MSVKEAGRLAVVRQGQLDQAQAAQAGFIGAPPTLTAFRLKRPLKPKATLGQKLRSTSKANGGRSELIQPASEPTIALAMDGKIETLRKEPGLRELLGGAHGIENALR